MNTLDPSKTLFLGWQDTNNTRAWYPVGRLSVDPADGGYVFGYTRGALAAREHSGFAALYDFPSFDTLYRSSDLFPLFRNRVMTPKRESFHAYLRQLAIANPDPDPLEILAVDGGYRVTDSFQVFPKIEKRENGAFRCRFFLHGWRHTNDAARARIDQLREGENLYVTIELTNPASGFAVQIQSEDYQMLGWAPRYLVGDLIRAMAHAPGDYRATVVKVNPMPAPSKQRVLIELSGHWPDDHEPMSSEEFQWLAR
jgi:hypothetical protein